ncbi:transposase [Streptomyces sp. NPDC052236]|uniref:transposase n=1 Tax=Streptomyces sp. NPDC052236 TaxID=3365686 RepID=UPI0037D860E3
MSLWDYEPVSDRRIDLLMPAPATAPHDGGALFPDDSGDRESGHATAYVSRQYLGSRRQVGNGIVAATTALADERVHYPPHTVPYQPAPTLPQGPADPAFRPQGQLAAHLVARARVAPPYVVAVEPNTPLMTETGESPYTVADHPADTMHLPLPLPPGPLTPCHPPLPRCRAPESCPLPPADMAGIVRCTGCAAGNVAFGFCWRQLPTSEPPVVSENLARAGAAQPVQPRTRQPVHHPGQGASESVSTCHPNPSVVILGKLEVRRLRWCSLAMAWWSAELENVLVRIGHRFERVNLRRRMCRSLWPWPSSRAAICGPTEFGRRWGARGENRPHIPART